jgi:hypothetical protein
VDAARAAKGEPLFVSFPRSPIVYSGLGATLYYSVFYHSYATQGKAKEIAFLPANMRKTFRIGEKRFFWVKLRALCCQKQWAAVKQLPTTVCTAEFPPPSSARSGGADVSAHFNRRSFRRSQRHQ